MKFHSEQEIYDFVGAFLIKQGKQSLRYDNYGQSFCAYRTSDGLACGAGCLFGDNEYVPEMEGITARSIKRFLEGDSHKTFDCFEEFIINIQKFHDDDYNWTNEGLRVDRLVKFGYENDLDVSKFT